MKNYKLLSVVTLVILVMVASCKKDDIPPIPKLTPESSFNMEFGDFEQEKSANLLIENWLYSALNVSFFNTIVSANMIIPTLAFNESFNYSPTYIEDQTWQWSYSFMGIGSTYTAKLNGITVKRNKVRWEMYIDKTGSNGFSNFLWFEGTTTDSTTATWIVYKNPSAPSVLIDIAWESNSDHTISSLQYTYRNSGADNDNSTIEFGKDQENIFDRNYVIFLASSNSTINIEWNSVLKNGRVKSPDYFKDETYHCWNENLFDDWCE